MQKLHRVVIYEIILNIFDFNEKYNSENDYCG